MELQILWVHDDFDGPVNGLGLYGGEKVWFARSQQPFIVASGDEALVPVPEPVRLYNLTRLSAEVLQIVEDNHVAYCEETGSPLNHGDPMIIKRKPQVVRTDPAKLIPAGETEVELDVQLKALLTVKTYSHQYDPNLIQGEFITSIDETNIPNYRVPRQVRWE